MVLATYIHVCSALIALSAAAVAVSVKKGKQPHIGAGYLFVITMLIMAIPAGVLSYQAGKMFDVLSSLLTGYMVLTGAFAFKPQFRSVAMAMVGLGLLCVGGYLAIELQGLLGGSRATDAPNGAGFVFTSILLCAIYGDIKQLRLTIHNREALLIRHLWRMNFAFFIATLNLFGVRPQFFPDWMQSSGLLALLAFAPLLIMAYWRLRLRSKRPTNPLAQFYANAKLAVVENAQEGRS